MYAWISCLQSWKASRQLECGNVGRKDVVFLFSRPAAIRFAPKSITEPLRTWTELSVCFLHSDVHSKCPAWWRRACKLDWVNLPLAFWSAKLSQSLWILHCATGNSAAPRSPRRMRLHRRSCSTQNGWCVHLRGNNACAMASAETGAWLVTGKPTPETTR